MYTRKMTGKTPNRKPLTLCFVIDAERVLLGKKKRGFGVDKWNGFGGKVHEDESMEEAAIRELEEEAGLVVSTSDLRKCAVLDFEYGDDLVHEVHVYLVDRYTGEAGETEEMLPQWFEQSKLPFSEMWIDDQYWLPHVLAGHTVQGTFEFDHNDRLIGHKLNFDTPPLEGSAS